LPELVRDIVFDDQKRELAGHSGRILQLGNAGGMIVTTPAV
jgi:hypothetical protein